MTSFRRTTLGLGVALLALGLAAPVLPKWALFLVTIAIAKGLVALGLLLLMRTGLVSFGQGLYFAAGGYAPGVAANALQRRATPSPWCCWAAWWRRRWPRCWGSCWPATAPSSSPCSRWPSR